MDTTIKLLIKRSNPTTIQTLVKNFEIEKLGYLYADVVEDAFNVKRGTASFGAAVINLFSEYKVNRTRLEDLDKTIKLSASKIKLHFSIEEKRKQAKIHNDAVDEFRILNEPLSLFVKRYNRLLKSEKHFKN